MYVIVTDKQYIPHTKSGDSHFLVLESDDERNESKYIYILIDDITSVDIVTHTRQAEIRLYVTARPTYVILQEDQRETLFDIMNSHMNESDDDSD